MSGGKILTSLGLLLKAIQITAGAVGVTALSSDIITLTAICLLNGGLCVFAYERRRPTSFFALISAVCGIAGAFKAEAVVFTYSFFFVSYFAYALMLMSMRHKRSLIAGLTVVGIAAIFLIISLGGIAVSNIVTAVLLDISYVIMLFGLYV